MDVKRRHYRLRRLLHTAWLAEIPRNTRAKCYRGMATHSTNQTSLEAETAISLLSKKENHYGICLVMGLWCRTFVSRKLPLHTWGRCPRWWFWRYGQVSEGRGQISSHVLLRHHSLMMNNWQHLCTSCRNLKLPSVLWHCWLDARKSIHPVKIEWWGVGVATAIPKPNHLVPHKSRLVLPFWYRLTQVVLKKRQLNGCSSSSVYKF